MADHKKLIPIILKWEGGWANDPSDLGGATMKGVTLATYESYCRKKGYPHPTSEQLRQITEAEWEEIFKTMYWDRWKADNIKSQSVANILVDWVWASGVHGIKNPQRVLEVSQDGIVGKNTLEALNKQDPKDFFLKIKAERIAFVDRICLSRPANNKFKKGWLNRIKDFNYDDED